MRMFSTSIYVQFAIHLFTQLVLRQHAANSHFNNAFRTFFKHVACLCKRRTTGITGMTEIRLLNEFFTCEFYFCCVYNDYIIACIYMRGKCRFMFSPKNFCDFGSKTT